MGERTAILQVADTGPLESLIEMLSAVGWNCVLPNRELRDRIRRLGCDTVVEIDGLVRHWGYDRPMALPEVGPEAMARTQTIYVDVKAHRNGPKVWTEWPSLRSRTLWYRINGSEPERVPSCGDEVTPPCPVLTPNRWYADPCGAWQDAEGGQGAYAVWPPFYRWPDYQQSRIATGKYEPPLCLIHNVAGWGYGALVQPMQSLGVKIHGVGAPNGLVNHAEIPGHLNRALAMVHLKSNDAPGYAIYEALASACPLICTRRLIWRCKMQDLLIPGETCLVFDRETHEGLSDTDVVNCVGEVSRHLERLRDQAENRKIGEAGRAKMKELMWSRHRPADVDSLRAFMGRFEE